MAKRSGEGDSGILLDERLGELWGRWEVSPSEVVIGRVQALGPYMTVLIALLTLPFGVVPAGMVLVVGITVVWLAGFARQREGRFYEFYENGIADDQRAILPEHIDAAYYTSSQVSESPLSGASTISRYEVVMVAGGVERVRICGYGRHAANVYRRLQTIFPPEKRVVLIATDRFDTEGDSSWEPERNPLGRDVLCFILSELYEAEPGWFNEAPQSSGVGFVEHGEWSEVVDTPVGGYLISVSELLISVPDDGGWALRVDEMMGV